MSILPSFNRFALDLLASILLLHHLLRQQESSVLFAAVLSSHRIEEIRLKEFLTALRQTAQDRILLLLESKTTLELFALLPFQRNHLQHKQQQPSSILVPFLLQLPQFHLRRLRSLQQKQISNAQEILFLLDTTSITTRRTRE